MQNRKIIYADDLKKKFLCRLNQNNPVGAKGEMDLVDIESIFSQMIEEQEDASDQEKWIPFEADETEHYLPEENQIILVSDGESVWEDLFMLNNGESWLMVQKKIGKDFGWQAMPAVYKAKEKGKRSG